MAIAQEKTTTLQLPLAAQGHVALMRSYRAAMVLIDSAIAALQGGSGISAAELLYDSGNPGDSNSVQTTVQGALDDLYSRVHRLEGRVDSNSQG